MSIGIGEALRAARVEQGRSVEEAARATRVRSDYIHALEDESFELFGSDVYAKGFIQSYARYLGLDAQPLLEAYRRYAQHDDYDPRQIATRPVAQPSRASLPGWVTWVGVGLVVLVIAVAAANLLGGRTPEPAQEPTAAPTVPSPAPRPSPTPMPTPTVTFEGVNVLVLVEEACWIQARVDGEVVESGRVYEPGETLPIEGDDRVEFTFGNAGGVRIEHNGRDLGPPGERGQVVNATYDEAGRVEEPADGSGGGGPAGSDPTATPAPA